MTWYLLVKEGLQGFPLIQSVILILSLVGLVGIVPIQDGWWGWQIYVDDM